MHLAKNRRCETDLLQTTGAADDSRITVRVEANRLLRLHFHCLSNSRVQAETLFVEVPLRETFEKDVVAVAKTKTAADELTDNLNACVVVATRQECAGVLRLKEIRLANWKGCVLIHPVDQLVVLL